jgi:dGTPase
MLAPYAVHVEQSRGRRVPEPPHPYRDSFQRDRDRVIHSRAFRRMEAKTQVFTRRYSDHFRNRLTHTIEVAQLSRTIASVLALNVDLVEALALVHDIGHPPFGHAGEKALDGAMKAHGESFDHNLHALHTIEHFELRYAAFAGLNLTFEVREGIVKHSRDYPEKEFPELAEYLLEQRPPLEAQLIDLTDEIAYDTADLDDGYEARLLTLDEICGGVPLFDRFYRRMDSEYRGAAPKLKFNEALKRVMDYLVTDLITATRERISAAGIRTLDHVRAHAARLAAFSPEADAERKQMKQFLYTSLYLSKALEPEKSMAEEIVTGLFEHWMRRPSDLPRGYQNRKEPLAHVIRDYIAGMTDPFILEQHARFCGLQGTGKAAR